MPRRYDLVCRPSFRQDDARLVAMCCPLRRGPPPGALARARERAFEALGWAFGGRTHLGWAANTLVVGSNDRLNALASAAYARRGTVLVCPLVGPRTWWDAAWAAERAADPAGHGAAAGWALPPELAGRVAVNPVPSRYEAAAAPPDGEVMVYAVAAPEAKPPPVPAALRQVAVRPRGQPKACLFAERLILTSPVAGLPPETDAAPGERRVYAPRVLALGAARGQPDGMEGARAWLREDLAALRERA